MPINRDGLEPGQLVDYETMRRVDIERSKRKHEPEKKKESKRSSKPAE